MAWSTPRSYPPNLLVTAAIMNQYQRDNLIAIDTLNTLTPGLICAYGDSAAAVPTGWLETDGTGGTNDIRERLIRGAGSTYAVGATGGAVTTTLAEHNAHTVGQPTAHGSHSITQPSNHTGSAGGIGGPTGLNDETHTGFNLDAHSAHSGQALTAGHTHSAVSVLPPYYAMRMLQKNSDIYAPLSPITWTTSDVPTAAQFNTELRDYITGTGGLTEHYLPNDAILMWDAALSGLPANWGECDGTGGRLNLRDKFLLVAKAGTYPAGTTGGATSIAVPNHAAHTATQSSGHSAHVVTQPSDHGSPVVVAAGATARATAGTHTGFAASAHTAHALFDVDAHSAHASLATLPPYYALYYIQLRKTISTRTWVTSELMLTGLLNTALRDNFMALYNSDWPIGGIGIWQGAIVSIPSGFIICDGAGGSPDLRDRFVVGAGGTYALAATGGSTSPSLAGHSAHVITEAAEHSVHTVTQGGAHPTSSDMSTGAGAVANGSAHVNAAASAAHTHSGSTVSTHSAHAPDTTPPYYAYAYVKRTS